MDWTSAYIDLFFSLALTILVYLFVPSTLLVAGKKYKKSTIKKIILINGCVCFLLFSIIQINSGNEGASPGACVLWTGVAYWMMNKCCLKVDPAINSCPHCGADIQSNAVMCFSCGCIIELCIQKRSSWKIVVHVVVYLVAIISILLNFAFASVINGTSEQDDLAAFVDEYVVFVEDDGTDLYHKYDCSRFVGDYFWAFNVDFAIDSGYQPCELCCYTTDAFAHEFTKNYLELQKHNK